MALIVMNLVTPKAADKHELLFYKPIFEYSMQVYIKILYLYKMGTEINKII